MLPVPWSSAVVVKQYAVLEMAAVMPIISQSGKNSMAVSTMAMVGPAARRVHMNIARHIKNVM
jgi:hypothetical protein